MFSPGKNQGGSPLGPLTQSIQSENFSRIPGFFPGFRENVQIGENYRNLRNSHSRGFERPRRSRSQHSTPGGPRCLSSASVVQMLAAASIKVMDALFGFLAQNDAEWTKRELLGRTWRRDWAMRKFQEKTWNPRYFPGSAKKSRSRENFLGFDALGMYTSFGAPEQLLTSQI